MSVILVDSRGFCFCNCATKCVVGKTGSSIRCTKENLESNGYRVIQVVDEKSDLAVMSAMVIDGKDHKLKIKLR